VDLRTLRYFLAIADALSFSKAAKLLHRSQPGLSRSIRELESQLGIELFERIGRRVQLSPNGVSLVSQARHLIADADELIQHAQRLAQGKSPMLRVGGASNTLERVMPDVLPLYRAAWPNVEVILRSEGGVELLTAVERSELDIAIARSTRSDILESKDVFPTHLLAIVGPTHRLAKRRSIVVGDLEGERLLVPPANFTSRNVLDSTLEIGRAHV